MASRKQQPKPVLNPHLTSIAGMLMLFGLGMIVASLVPGSVVALLVLVAVVIVVLWLTAIRLWQVEYRMWTSKPVRVKRLPRSGASV